MNESFEGIVLFKRPYRDHDALVKIFTEKWGTKMFFVKGLNKPNHPLMSYTLPLTKNQYIGTINQQGLSFLKEGQSLSMYRHLQMDVDFQAYAAYIVQLVDAATADNEPNPTNYQLLEHVLDKLNQQLAPQLITTYVELFLLPQFGTHINFDQCLYCDEAKGPFDLSLRQQGLLCSKHYHMDEFRLRIHPNAIYIVQQLQTHALNHIQSVNLNSNILSELRRLMDEIYKEFVGLRLKSKSYLDQLEKIHDEANLLKDMRQKNKNVDKQKPN